jgi:hypothetical protein
MSRNEFRQYSRMKSQDIRNHISVKLQPDESVHVFWKAEKHFQSGFKAQHQSVSPSILYFFLTQPGSRADGPLIVVTSVLLAGYSSECGGDISPSRKVASSHWATLALKT